MADGQKPLELILARNLLASISTPSFLVDTDGLLVFFNEAAGDLLGVRYEETGPMGPDDWGQDFGPYGEDGKQVPFEELPLTIALRHGRPAHARFTIQSKAGERHEIEVSALPLLGTGGFRGALAFFWLFQDDVAAAAPAADREEQG